MGTNTAFTNTWSPNIHITNSNTLNPSVSPLTTQKYYLIATTRNCTKVDSVTVTDRPALIPNAGADCVLCLSRSTLLSGSGGVGFNWTPTTYLSSVNLANPISTPLQSITYGLNVTDAFGYVSLFAASVTVSVSPPLIISSTADTLIATNQPLQLNAAGAPSFIWLPSTNLSAANIANPIAQFNNPGIYNYIVRGFNSLGCFSENNLKIRVYKGPEIYVPTAFTPNGDGKNDVLQIQTVGIKSFNFICVYNRWGQQVFITTNATQGWDGRTKNGKIVTGTYV